MRSWTCSAPVNCAAVLEKMGQPWRLDKRGSTKRALKYRRGEGEIMIVNHDGHGWWDRNPRPRATCSTSSSTSIPA